LLVIENADDDTVAPDEPYSKVPLRLRPFDVETSVSIRCYFPFK
jgi:hypothetical protein